MPHRSRNSGREFAGWNRLLCGPVHARISCTNLKIQLAHADSSIVPKQNFVLYKQFRCRTSLCFTHRSRNSGREFVGWNQLPCGPVLTPNNSCTKLKIYSAHADSLIVPKHVLNLVQAIDRTILCFTDQETQEENLQGGTSSLVGQFLHPISLVQSSRSIQHMLTVHGLFFGR